MAGTLSLELGSFLIVYILGDGDRQQIVNTNYHLPHNVSAFKLIKLGHGMYGNLWEGMKKDILAGMANESHSKEGISEPRLK